MKTYTTILCASMLGLFSTVINAAPVTALYESTIDLSGLGGASNAMFQVEYIFDTNEADSLPGDPVQGFYPNVSGNALIGTDNLSFTGGGINISNDNASGDQYTFALGGGSSISGTVLGLSIIGLQFQLFDFEGTMFVNDSLPADLSFASSIDAGWNLLRDASIPTGPFSAATYSSIAADGQFFTLTEVSAVPIPAAVWFFGSGLGFLGFTARRKTTA